MKQNICVIGIGNEFRQDDGVGIYIARNLRKREMPDVAIMEHQTGGTDIISEWEGYQTVILVDAVSSGDNAGKTYRFVIPGDQLPKSVFCASTHTFNIADCIELARALNQLPEKLIIYGIEGKNFQMQEGLSKEVLIASQKVIDDISEEITDLIDVINEIPRI